MDSDRRASDALFDRLVARLVPVVMDAGADGRRVFYVPSPDAPDPVIADVARAWADLRRDPEPRPARKARPKPVPAAPLPEKDPVATRVRIGRLYRTEVSG